MSPKTKTELLFQDDHLLVANKPPGLLSIPDRHHPELPNLQALLTKRFGRTWVVHRLDRETSGALCFGRNAEAHRDLSLQFEHRQVKKTYLALIEGQPPREEDDIELPMAPHPGVPGKMTINRRGKPALSHYRVKEAYRRFSLLEVDLHTGRTHQIRVHLAAIGCPLAVDPLYGRREELLLSEIKGRKYRANRHQEERPLLARLSLHAWRLVIRHPVSQEEMTFEAPLPKDLSACIRQLSKWDCP